MSLCAGPAESGFVGAPGVDGERVDAARHQGLQGIIYEAMTRDAAKFIEARADDPDREMTAFPGPGMAGMEVAVVLDRERQRRERRAQRRFDLGRLDAHRAQASFWSETGAATASSSRMWRTMKKPCTSMNSSSRADRPKTLKVAQNEVEKL